MPREDPSTSPTVAPPQLHRLERGGVAVAALIHDRSLENDPTLVAVVAGAAALAIENERLQADVRARLAESPSREPVWSRSPTRSGDGWSVIFTTGPSSGWSPWR